MAQKIIITHTANCRDRTEDIRYIILHCSSYSPDKQLDILDKYGLSTHYIVSERGQITENAPLTKLPIMPAKAAGSAAKANPSTAVPSASNWNLLTSGKRRRTILPPRFPRFVGF